MMSQSKLQKGDATFSTEKRILGWNVNTYTMTLQLPQHKMTQLMALLDTFAHKQHTSRKHWQQLRGTLCSSTPVLYGEGHLFSAMQDALINTTSIQLHLTGFILAMIKALKDLAITAYQRPVPWHTVVPHPPDYVGALDASKQSVCHAHLSQLPSSITW